MPTIAYKNKAGERVPSQSTIKSQIGWSTRPLLYWANAQGLEGRTLKEAQDTATVSGTIAHHLIECFIRDTEPDLSSYSEEDIEKGRSAFSNFEHWWFRVDVDPVYVEPNLVSEEWQFGGTPDLVCYVSGEFSIVDWKSGKWYEDGFLQLAAYRQLVEENCPFSVKAFHILRIPRNEDPPSFKHLYFQGLPFGSWEAFECALKLHKLQKILKEKL